MATSAEIKGRLGYSMNPSAVRYRAYLLTVNPNTGEALYIDLQRCGLTDISISEDADSPVASASLSVYNAPVNGVRLNQLIRPLDRVYIDANYGLGWTEVFRGRVYTLPYSSGESKMLNIQCKNVAFTLVKSRDVFVVESAGTKFGEAIRQLLKPYMAFGEYNFFNIKIDDELEGETLDVAVYRPTTVYSIIQDMSKRILIRTSAARSSKRIYVQVIYGNCEQDGSRNTNFEGTIYFGCRKASYDSIDAAFSATEVEEASYAFDISDIVTEVGVQVIHNQTDDTPDEISGYWQSYTESSPPPEAVDVSENTSIDFLVAKTLSDGSDLRKYGIYREIVSPSQSDDLGDTYAEGRDYASLILEEFANAKYTYSASAVDVPILRPWQLISVEAGANVGIFLIQSIEHSASEAKMSLQLTRRSYGIPISELRAQPNAASIKETDPLPILTWEGK